jgi:hypothetical protein
MASDRTKALSGTPEPSPYLPGNLFRHSSNTVCKAVFLSVGCDFYIVEIDDFFDVDRDRGIGCCECLGESCGISRRTIWKSWVEFQVVEISEAFDDDMRSDPFLGAVD